MTNGNDLTTPDIITEPAYDAHTGAAYSDTYSIGGLTKREYFAAMAMQGLLAHGDVDKRAATQNAVRLADYLIAELNKEQR